MRMIFFRTLAVAVAGLFMPTLAASSPASQSASPELEVEPRRIADGTLLSRESYAFPYARRDDWLAFLRGLPDLEAIVAADAFAELFSVSDYAGWAEGRTTTTTRIEYASDGLRIRGFLIEPRTPGPHPVIVFNQGGIGRYGRIVLWDLLELNRLAARGYVILASTFRGEGGSEGRPDFGDGDADDTLTLMTLAETLPTGDARRIGMWGFSRGGLTTYTALARTDRVAAAVIIGGPVDLMGDPRRAEFDNHVYPNAIPGYGADPDGELRRRSPLQWADCLAPRAAILLLHGGDDPRVVPSASLRMATALQELKRSYRLKIYEGGGHDLLADFTDVRREVDRWFDHYVRDAVPAPANGEATLPVAVTEDKQNDVRQRPAGACRAS